MLRSDLNLSIFLRATFFQKQKLLEQNNWNRKIELEDIFNLKLSLKRFLKPLRDLDPSL